MKKIFLLLFLSFFLTGCVSYTELNELGIISALTISHQDGEFLVTTQFILPRKDDGESTYEMETYASKGISIEDALNQIYLKSNKKIYLSHLEFVAIDEEIAKNHLKETVSFFLQDEEARGSFPIVLVKGENIETLLDNEKSFDVIYHLLEMNQQEYGTAFSLSLEDFARMLLEQKTAVLPTIQIEDGPKSQGLAIFKQQSLKGYLTEEESNAYLFLTNKIIHLSLSIPCTQNESSIIKVLENTTLVSNKENKIIIEIKSKIEGDYSSCQSNLTTLYEQEILSRIWKLLEKTKREDIDILQFSNFIYRNDYSYYKKKKDDLFRQLTYDIRFQTEVIHHRKTKGGFS